MDGTLQRLRAVCAATARLLFCFVTWSVGSKPVGLMACTYSLGPSSTTALNSHRCDIQSELTVFKLLNTLKVLLFRMLPPSIPIFVMCRNGKRDKFSCVSLNSNTADCGNNNVRAIVSRLSLGLILIMYTGWAKKSEPQILYT